MTPATSVGRISALIQAAAAVVGESDLDQLLRRLVTEARLVTGARYAALGVLGEHGVLTDFIHEGVSAERARDIGNPPTGRGVLGIVVRERRTIRLDSITEHPDAYGFPQHHPVMTSFLGVAITAGAQAFGNLYLTDKEGGFTDEDVAFIEALSRIAGAAVHTARLQERLRRVAVVEDRERIARDLHDTVIQDLFAVGLALQGLSERVSDSPSGDILDDAVDQLDHSVEALRAYIFQLRVGGAPRLDLDERLQELVARMGSAYPATVRLEVDVEPIEDHQVEDEVMKVVTEALSNALRHAAAGNVEVSVNSADRVFRVVVSDDGAGFDPAVPVDGMGLSNIRTRAVRLGGTCDVRSTAGHGTVVEVTLPFR